MLHDGSHGDDCFGCKVKTLQISPKALPTRRNQTPPRHNTSSNAWERGIVRDSRNMPLLDSNAQPVGLKEYQNDRHKYEEARRKLEYNKRRSS